MTRLLGVAACCVLVGTIAKAHPGPSIDTDADRPPGEFIVLGTASGPVSEAERTQLETPGTLRVYGPVGTQEFNDGLIAASAPSAEQTPTGFARHMYAHHMTPQQVGELAAAAQVERLIITHRAPNRQRPEQMQRHLDAIREIFSGEVMLTWSASIDWRNTVVQTRIPDGYYLNSSHTPDIAAPGSVHSQPLPPNSAGAASIDVTPVADGIWHLNPGGHTVIEFDDHLVIFELSGSAEHARAALDLANTLVQGKPLTHLIVSHHHFDHTRGFRTAVDAGLTITSHRGNEAILKEMAARPSLDFAELAGLPDGGTFDFVPADTHLRLEDSSITLDISFT